MGSLEKELSVGLRIDFSVKSMVLSRRLVGKRPTFVSLRKLRISFPILCHGFAIPHNIIPHSEFRITH